MRLKVITSFFFLVVFVLVLASPVMFRGAPGSEAPKEQRRAYAEKTLGYLGVLVFAFVGAGVGSFLVYRQARREYEEESVRNLRNLLEAPIKPPKGSTLEEDQEKSDDGA